MLGVVCDMVIGDIGGLHSPIAWELTLVAKPAPVKKIYQFLKSLNEFIGHCVTGLAIKYKLSIHFTIEYYLFMHFMLQRKKSFNLSWGEIDMRFCHQPSEKFGEISRGKIRNNIITVNLSTHFQPQP